MKNLKKELKDLLKNYYRCINIAYLFGSSVNGYVKKGSDIDIALDIDKEFLALNPTIGLEIELFLQDRLKVPVEVVVLNKANSILKYNVIKTGIRLFEKDSRKRALTELCIFKGYIDSIYYQKLRSNYGK